jgi:hypothetical protein
VKAAAVVLAVLVLLSGWHVTVPLAAGHAVAVPLPRARPGRRTGRVRGTRLADRPDSRMAPVAVPREDRMMWRWLRANWARLVCGLALAAVAAVAGIISYDHIESLTLALHQAVIVARLMPFGVDGLIVVGSVVLLTTTPGTEWMGWLGVGPGVAASVFANVESGIRYGWLAATWAGVPAGSFFLPCFLLERWIKAQASVSAEARRADLTHFGRLSRTAPRVRRSPPTGPRSRPGTRGRAGSLKRGSD